MTEDKDYTELLLNAKAVMETTAGRRLLWHILDICGIYAPSFTGNSQTYFNEGRRSVGIHLLGLMDDADPTCYPSMLLENVKKLQSLEVNDAT